MENGRCKIRQKQLGVMQILAFVLGLTQNFWGCNVNGFALQWNIGLSNKSETQFPLTDPQLQAYQYS